MTKHFCGRFAAKAVGERGCRPRTLPDHSELRFDERTAFVQSQRELADDATVNALVAHRQWFLHYLPWFLHIARNLLGAHVEGEALRFARRPVACFGRCFAFSLRQRLGTCPKLGVS